MTVTDPQGCRAWENVRYTLPPVELGDYCIISPTALIINLFIKFKTNSGDPPVLFTAAPRHCYAPPGYASLYRLNMMDNHSYIYTVCLYICMYACKYGCEKRTPCKTVAAKNWTPLKKGGGSNGDLHGCTAIFS